MATGGLRTLWTRIGVQRPTLFARCAFLISCLLLTNLVLWIAAIITSPPSKSSFTSLALIAWTTGLRHALDADHITAIDNATRRLISIPLKGSEKLTVKEKIFFWRQVQHTEKAEDIDAVGPHRRPTTVGLFFSLGHSTIVVAVTLAVAISVSVAGKLSGVGDVGGIIGQSVSGSFLFLVAVINSVILAKTIRARRAEKRIHHQQQQQQEQKHEPDGEKQIQPEHTNGHDEKIPKDGKMDQGPIATATGQSPEATARHHAVMTLMTRLTSPLLKAVTRPWHMYIVGVLFGIGFDTASTIALLSIASSAGKSSDSAVDESEASQYQGSNAKVILLAFLFTAGMTLVDSLDSVMMIYAYAPPNLQRGKKWYSLWERQQSDSSSKDIEEQPRSDCKDIEEQPQKTTRRPTFLSSSAKNLSLVLTLLSICIAFIISIIVIMSLLAENCKSCARSLELHQEPENGNNGGLAGRWWNFWSVLGEQSGYIGAGIVALFLFALVIWWSVAWVQNRRHRKTETKA
ncbi:unnamed protein product [Sympodiomycopsis kandeliae]